VTHRTPTFFAALTVAAITAAAQTPSQTDEPVTFRSDVSLVRVDVQVMDGSRAVTGLHAEDFILRENGRVREIRNFASEKMPIDILFLLDVSASMRPHVQRIASAARQALSVMSDKDRVGIMVFDRATRVRLPFREYREDIDRDFQNVLRQESFRGGTDITLGMMDAARYVENNARSDARRAIVILTDDETEFQRDDERVLNALDRARAVMSALIAPDAMAGRYGGGGYPSGGMGRRRGGIGMGGIGIPGVGIPGGGGYPNGGGYPANGSHTRSAGTSEIARDSGGDSLPVDDASSLETTLARLRQRYSLYFQLPPGTRKGQQRSVEISLTDAALRRYSYAELRYRHTYIAPSDGPAGSDTVISDADRSGADRSGAGRNSADPNDDRPTLRRTPRALSDTSDPVDDPAVVKKRPAVSGPGGSTGGPIIIKPDNDKPENE
jgi:VWFA-related protein